MDWRSVASFERGFECVGNMFWYTCQVCTTVQSWRVTVKDSSENEANEPIGDFSTD